MTLQVAEKLKPDFFLTHSPPLLNRMVAPSQCSVKDSLSASTTSPVKFARMRRPSAAYRKAVLAPDRDAPGGADHGLALASCRVTAVTAAATAKVAEATVDKSVGPAHHFRFDYGGALGDHDLGVFSQPAQLQAALSRTRTKAAAPWHRACLYAESCTLSRSVADCRR